MRWCRNETLRSVALALFIFLSTVFSVLSQTFPGEAGALIPPGAPGVTIGLTTAICSVDGIGIIGEGCREIDNVAIDITHTYTGDLGIFIISPGGDVLELTSGNGGTGNNFTNTVFTDHTDPFITQGVAPYTGIWRPEGRQQSLTLPYPNGNPLGTYTFDNVFDGVDADGDWTLYINDFLLIDVGIINSWSITFTGGPGPVPTVDIGPDVIICEGLPATLVADVDPTADTWEWSTGETTQTITVEPDATTTYMVTVTNNGCTDADTITVIVQPNNINANAGPDGEICSGQSILLTGSGAGSSFEWSNGQTGPLITVDPVITTTYTLTVSDGICESTDEATVEVLPTPIADAGPPVSICDGESTILEASGGNQNNQYSWSTGQNTQSIVVSPYINTTYTVTVNIDGCEDEDDVEVTVLPQPSVDAGDDVSVCIGESIQLTASGTGGDYEWDTGQTTNQITVSPTSTTTYTVSLTENGCTAEDEVEVDVIDVVADVSPDLSICEGDSEVLSASGGTDYEWSTGQTTAAITVSPQSSTIYTVTVSEGSCVDIGTVQVDVYPAPMVNISSPDEICSGDFAMITATGGTSYLWSTGATGPSISVSPLVTTLYTVTVSDPGCSTVDSVTIIVHPSPSISLGPPVSLCAGDSVHLQVTGLSGNETLIWNTGDTGAALEVAPLGDAVYSVTATDPFGCANESNVTITVLPAPDADLGPDIFIMTGEMVTLFATGTGTFLWSTGETTSQIVVSPTVTTSYSVTVTLNGCTDVDEMTVFVNEVPPVDLGTDLTICPGDTVTLNASVPGPFMLGYQWSNGETDSSITVAPLADATFIITVTDLVSGFFSIDTVQIFVGSLPLGQPLISGPGEGCLQSVDVYNASGVTGATTYTWVVSGGSILSGQGTQNVNVSWTNGGPQQIMLMVSNDCGELPEIVFNTNVLTTPVLPGTVSGPTEPCVFAPAGYSIPSLPEASSYNWIISGGGMITSGQGTPSILVDWNGALSGTICVEALNVCGVSSQVCMNVMPTQSPVISAGPDLGTCEQMLTLQGTGGGTWDIISGIGQVSITDPVNPQTTIMSQFPGNYILVYESGAAGCEASDTVLVAFHPSPAITQVNEICSNDLMSYTVSFQIMGGQSPYLVNGSVIPTNPFVSGQIPAGTSYMFQAEDNNGCVSPVITGVQSCDCPLLAGEMDTTQINRCIGDSLIALSPVGTVTAPGDTIAFILHDGQIPGGIIAWSFQPVFPFFAGLQAGQTYYISAVVGPKGQGGFPDANEACFDWSLGTPFVFYDLPLVDLAEMVIIGCDPQWVQLDIGNSAAGPDYLYSWTADAGGMISGTTDSTVVIAESEGSYILTIEHLLSGCKNTGEIVVAEDHVDLSELQFDTEPPLCAGDCNGQILITQSGTNWLFDFGDGVYTDSIIQANSCSGSFVLNIINELGCMGDTTYTIPEKEPLSVDLGPDRTINPGEEIQLEASSLANIVMYNWFPLDSCTLCPVILVQPEETTLYQIEVIDENGCAGTDEVLISVRISKDIFLPNVFSPNDDQINDELGIPEHRELASIHRFDIFDRWGNLVFHITNPLPGSQSAKWDGTYREKAVSPGVYSCVAEVEFRDGTSRQLVWDVTLIR